MRSAVMSILRQPLCQLLLRLHRAAQLQSSGPRSIIHAGAPHGVLQDFRKLNNHR